MNKNIELSVHPAFIDEASGYRFEPLRDKKGKRVYRHPRVGEWYITEDAEIARHPWCEDDECGQILRAIPINPPPPPSCSTCSHEYEQRSEEVRHYDGEEWHGPISYGVNSTFPPEKYKFVFTGERKTIPPSDLPPEQRQLFLYVGMERKKPEVYMQNMSSHYNVWIVKPQLRIKPARQWKKGEWAFHPGYKLLYVASETDIHGEHGFIFHPLHSGNTNVIISGHHLDVLREVKDSDWPVGAWITYIPDNFPAKIKKVRDGCIYFDDNFNVLDNFRPLHDSDWIVEIDRVKYRAYGGSQELIKLRQWNEKNKWWEDCVVTKEIVKALGVPVMPLEFQWD